MINEHTDKRFASSGMGSGGSLVRHHATSQTRSLHRAILVARYGYHFPFACPSRYVVTNQQHPAELWWSRNNQQRQRCFSRSRLTVSMFPRSDLDTLLMKQPCPSTDMHNHSPFQAKLPISASFQLGRRGLSHIAGTRLCAGCDARGQPLRNA